MGTGRLTPAERKLRAQAAAHASWAGTPDPSARTAPANRGFLARFERQVDPDCSLPPKERQRRAESAKRAYMTALSYRAARARTERKREQNG
jgi:hypothetical protein